VGSRYRPLRLHACGGLGEVYLARDEELSREVALKRMRWPQAGDVDSRRRFLREGEITGGLEHPGVVPVYGLTRHADGQPWCAMRFVRGQTLQAAIARYHATAEADRSLALRQLLGRFVVVCNTIAYAHSCGVVHRDIKPANIMLGDYGETLVVDWGLAKRVGIAGEVQPSSGDDLPRKPTDGREDGTATGDVLGTPAFMSPEQAAGRHDAVAPASDVYGLGATLYALLTGGPPFPRDSVAEVLRKVERGDFPPPRQLRPDTPRALEAICLKAMTREPAARYATALDLAADLERWLADEPVKAHREPWLLRLGRWGRRHRPLVAAATALVVTAVVLGGLGAWWLDRQQAERRRGVEGALAEVGRLQGQAEWYKARAVLDQVQDRLADGGPVDLRGQLEEARANLEMVERLDELRLQRGSWIATGDFISAPAYVEAFRKAFRDRGLAVDSDAARLLEQIQASAIRGELVAALDEWTWFTPDPDEQARLLAVARQADPHPWRNRLRDPVVRKDGQALKQLATEAPLSELSPFLLLTFASALGRMGGDQEALLRQAQQIYPGDFWINFDLAFLLSNRISPDLAFFLFSNPGPQGEAARTALEEANGFYRAAMAARPQSSLAWTLLGATLGKQGKLAEAEAAARKAIRLQGDNSIAHLDLSANLNRQGRYTEAEAICQDFIQRVRSDYHRIYLNLSVALENLGDEKRAKAACDKAISLNRSYARSWSRRGSVLYRQENYSEAERDFREAFRLDPESGEALIGITDSLRSQQKFTEGEAYCRDVMRTRPKYAPAYLGLGDALKEQGQFTAALEAYRRGEELGRKELHWTYDSKARIREAEQLVAVEAQLATGLKEAAGSSKPPAPLTLAQFYLYKRHYAAAARYFAQAYTAQPKLAEETGNGNRYNAACCALRASCGQGEDAAKLDDKQRADWRQEALDWLRGDLKQLSKQLADANPKDRIRIKQTLQHWQRDADLAKVRGEKALAKLRDAEHFAWQQLWADVEVLLKRAEEVK
jgi:serine/threonine-protein kinase